MTKDLSKMTYQERGAFLSAMTFEERQSFFNNRLDKIRIQNYKESSEREKLATRLFNNASLTNRLANLSKKIFSTKEEREKQSTNEIIKNAALNNYLFNGNNWKRQILMGKDGLVYGTNQISLKGKTLEDVRKMQQILFKKGIYADIAQRPNPENQVFYEFLAVSDPISNQLLDDEINYRKLQSTCNNPVQTVSVKCDNYYIPLTKAEYDEKTKATQIHQNNSLANNGR